MTWVIREVTLKVSFWDMMPGGGTGGVVCS